MNTRDSRPTCPVEGFIISGCNQSSQSSKGVINKNQNKNTNASAIAVPVSGRPDTTETRLVNAPGQVKTTTGAATNAGKMVPENRPSTSKSTTCKGNNKVPLFQGPSTSKEAQAKLPASASSQMPLNPRSTSGVLQNAPRNASQPSKETMYKPTGLPAEPRPSKRHITPARRAFLERRAAARKLQLLGDKPVDALTPEESVSLTWAKKTLADFQAKNSSTSSDAPKRQRSEEDPCPSQQPDTKRPRPARLMDRSFSEVAKGHLVKAIIDRSDVDGAISPERWELIRVRLVEVVINVLKDNPGPPPNCSDAGWFQGRVKLLACHNERSAFLLKKAVQLMDGIWDGARLDVVSKEEIPRRPRSTALVPNGKSTAKEILELLQISNPNLPVHDWKVVKVSEPEGALRKIIVILTQESLAPLREMRGKIFYGFEEIFLHVYRGDDKDTGAKDNNSSDPPVRNEDASDPPPLSLSQDSTISLGCVGDLMDMEEDEDFLLNSGLEDEDQEEANVTVIPTPWSTIVDEDCTD